MGRHILDFIQDTNLKIIVTIHPNEYKTYDKNIKPLGEDIDALKEFGVIVRKPNENFIPYLAMSDLVLSDFSSMGDHAIMCGKQICYFNFDNNKIFDYACCKLLKDKFPIFYDIKDFEKCVYTDYPIKAMDEINKMRDNMVTTKEFWNELCQNLTNEIMRGKK